MECIISGNAAAVNILRAIFEVAGNTRTWNTEDECEDYWHCIAQHINQSPPHHHATKWVPSHMGDPNTEYQKKLFLDAGGGPEWIKGNVEADKLADAGTKLQAPPQHLVLREK